MITIKIDKSNKCRGEYSAYVMFDYDEDIVDIVKSQPIRYYNPDKKIWEIPLRTLNILEEDLNKDYEYKICDKNGVLNDLNKKTSNYIPKDYKFKIEPFKHQIEGIEYGLKYDRFLLGDEQRLAEKQCKPYQ